MSGFKDQIFIFLMLGIGVLGLCVCIMIPFWYSTVKIESDLWNNLRTNVYEHYFELKQSLIDRLKCIHSQNEISISKNNPSNKSFTYKNYWKYIWRIFVYFIVVALFSIINIAYLYKKCTDYLSYRPEIIKELIRGQFFLNLIAIASTNSQLERWGLPLANYIPNEYFLVNSLPTFQNYIKNVERSRLILRDHKYLPILSEKFKRLFFEQENDPNWYYFDYGAFAAEDIINFDSYSVTYSNLDTNFWLFWIVNLEESARTYRDFSIEIDGYSQSVIEDQVKIITMAFVVFAMSSGFIYFLLYFQFFRKEKHYLRKINSIMKIIP
ncbi:unnamed protein product [Blepharisma stoltei]|uniref:Uncharacterized protein n=1 Tax=Blepharisma stoltei TaxID=1481888 RepID=A0AAU9IG51_9CILI|nr:unnamed protein product [Blepharisma stoltei]